MQVLGTAVSSMNAMVCTLQTQVSGDVADVKAALSKVATDVQSMAAAMDEWAARPLSGAGGSDACRGGRGR